MIRGFLTERPPLPRYRCSHWQLHWIANLYAYRIEPSGPSGSLTFSLPQLRSGADVPCDSCLFSLKFALAFPINPPAYCAIAIQVYMNQLFRRVFNFQDFMMTNLAHVWGRNVWNTKFDPFQLLCITGLDPPFSPLPPWVTNIYIRSD